MSARSNIEWTEQTWNPVTGCTKVSAGCKNCYAETLSRRLKAMGIRGYENGFEVSLLPQRLIEPIRRRKPTTYFVNSMSDLFHEEVPFWFIDEILEVMECTPQHIYQVLTKRSERMLAYFESDRRAPKNLWLGVSVENKRHGIPRIGNLQRITASVRFLSLEPLLEDLGCLDLTGIHWAIVGGESGPHARRMKEEWVDGIRRQCEDAGVAFFFKQWGSWGSDGIKRSKKRNGRKLEGRTWDECPTSVTG